MKLHHRAQRWKKWFRKKITRYRIRITWTENYNRPVADFFRGWIEYLKGPKTEPTVLINGEQVWDIPEPLQDIVNAEAAKSEVDYPVVRITLALPPKQLGGKYRVRNPNDQRLGSNSSPRRIEARNQRAVTLDTY